MDLRRLQVRRLDVTSFSMSAIIIGVASTGISPEPTFIAVTASVTVNSLVCFKPISTINNPKYQVQIY